MVLDSDRGRYTSPEGSALWEYIATMSCSLLIFCVGCIPGWNSPTLGILRRSDTPIALTSSDASTLSSMITLGHAVAPFFTIIMANKFGRKNSILVAGIPAIISWGLISFADNIIILSVGRFIGGFSLGLIYCIPQMYLGEIASPKLRGTISMVCGTMINAGIFFMFVAVPYLSVQTMARISMSIVTVSVIIVWFIPESPYFLATVGKLDEAESVLGKLRGKIDVTEELELIKLTTSQKGRSLRKRSAEDEPGVPGKFSAWEQLFFVAGNRKALFINLLFPAVLYFGSYIIMMAYGEIIFGKMTTEITVHVSTMIVALLQIICNILIAVVIDKLGRKPFIWISGLLSSACLLIVGVYFYLMEYTKINVTQYGMIALCASFVNIIALNVGLMPLQHVIQSEILANDIKELATCIIGVGGGLMGTIGVKSYLMLAETWGFGHSVPFFICTAVTSICTALIVKLLPETRGKTLYEIQRDLNA